MELPDLSSQLARPLQEYQRWRYRNTALLVLSLGLFWYFADSELVQGSLARVGSLGYLGAFISGMFFVSVFTVAPAAAVLFGLAEGHDPILLAFLAGLGAVIGDYIILRVLKDRVFHELTPLAEQLGGSFVMNLFRTPYFSWAVPFVGAVIIASPLPDEVGIGLMGLSRVKAWQFLLIAFVLNALGIFAVITAATLW